ncbi:MAG: DNRLRE domain-containing protein [Euryarchaeota archaeon]|nr:DNRLRE domain-containing protein [Euryarchaeota archaeon]
MSLNKFKTIRIIMLMLMTIPLVSATVTNIIASEDTYSYFLTPDANMGGNTEVSVWNYYGRQSDYAYIKFANISGTGSPNIPSNSNINSATMWLYTRAGESQTITFYTPSASWTESSLTWNNQPSPVTPYALVAQDGSTAHWTSVDVTNIVHKWNDGTITNNGLVALSDGGGASASTDWRSKENLTNKPYILVDFTAPSSPPPSPTTPAPTETLTSTPNPCSTSTSSVNLHGEKTDVIIGENVLLKLSAINIIGNPIMHVQVIIIPPNGWSVTSSEFSKSGAGQYVTMYDLKPVDGSRDIEVNIMPNQIGDNFEVKGRIIYYFGDDLSTKEDCTLKLPIKVKENSTTNPSPTSTTMPQPPTPGLTLTLWISILILFLICVLYFKYTKLQGRR